MNRRDEEGKVADQPHALAVRVPLQTVGLTERRELDEGHEADLIREFALDPVERCGLALHELFRPIKVISAPELSLDRPQERIVIQPVRLIMAEPFIGGPQIRMRASVEVGPGRLKKLALGRNDGVVVDFGLRE